MSEGPWRVVFYSMALPAVQRFAEFVRALGHEPVGLVTPPPRDEPEARERFASLVAGAGLDVAVPAGRERLGEVTRLLEPDLVLCMGFSWKVPRDVLEIPRLGIVNSHPSLLPRYRGPIPFAWAIRNRDPELGLTFHRMDEEYDTGAVLAQGAVPIGPNDTFVELAPKIGELSMRLLPRVFERLAAGDPGDPQAGEPSYAGFFEDDYVWIDWTKPRDEIHAQVRAWVFAGGRTDGPLTELDGEVVRVLRSSLVPVEGAREVAAADGPLWIVETEKR